MLPFAPHVSAHANLVRSEPQAGATLEVAPEAVVLEFSEELDPEFSRVQLIDERNQKIVAGAEIDASSPRVLRLTLGTLPKGVYTAIWRVRSLVDGHVTEGSVPFGVGVVVNQTSRIPPPGTPEPATPTPPPGSSILRWLSLLTAALALGTIPFGLFVWRPAFQAVQDRQLVEADQGALLTARRLIAIGGISFLLVSVLFFIDQAASAAGVSFTQALGAPLALLLKGRFGTLWLTRVGLMLLVIALAFRLRPLGQDKAWLWWLALVLGGGILLTFSLNSHGAAEPQGALLATTLDWLHLAATIVWLGGLVPLGFAIATALRDKNKSMPLDRLIPRFSVIAVICVVLLAVTGIYSYQLHVGDLKLLIATTYGQALTFKTALFALLILFGAINLLILSPGLRRINQRLTRSFARTVRIELAIGALVLLAVGAMTSIAPSKTAWADQEQLGIVQSAKINDVNMRLQVAPAHIGDNEIALDITDQRAGVDDAPAQVLMRFSMQGMDMGNLQTEMSYADQGRYVTRGTFLSMGGRWNVEVIVRRTALEDVRHTFVMDIVKSARL